MKLGIDTELEQVFKWLTRIGAGVHFGSRPIGWYQMHQCAAIDVLEAKLKEASLPLESELRSRGGVISARNGKKWVRLTTTGTVFQLADDKARA